MTATSPPASPSPSPPASPSPTPPVSPSPSTATTTWRDRPDLDALAERLDLRPHPEGGSWAQTWIGPRDADGRPSGTAIAFLLHAGERSHWHRLDADEVWHRQAGGPLALSMWSGSEDEPVITRTIGMDVSRGEVTVAVVPAGWWQSAQPLGKWSLVACTMTPGWHEGGFELAPADWSPSRPRSLRPDGAADR